MLSASQHQAIADQLTGQPDVHPPEVNDWDDFDSGPAPPYEDFDSGPPPTSVDDFDSGPPLPFRRRRPLSFGQQWSEDEEEDASDLDLVMPAEEEAPSVVVRVTMVARVVGNERGVAMVVPVSDPSAPSEAMVLHGQPALVRQGDFLSVRRDASDGTYRLLHVLRSPHRLQQTDALLLLQQDVDRLRRQSNEAQARLATMLAQHDTQNRQWVQSMQRSVR